MFAPEPEIVARKRLLKAIDEAGGAMACATTDPELWFPEQAVSSPAAKKLCQECPVRQQCFEFALWHFQQFGIWGGTTAKERTAMRTRLGIEPRPDSRQTLDYWLLQEHSQSPRMNRQQQELQPECSEFDERLHPLESQG